MFFNSTILVAIIAFSLMFITSCSDNSTEPTVDESALLLQYLESSEGGDYINTSGFSMVTAADTKTALTDNSWFLIDVRADSAFARGHIQGAVNVQLKDLLSYYQTNNLAAKAKVVLVCYSGQTASYAAGLLQLYGYKNVFSLKYGMSSWNEEFNIWKSKTTNTYYSQWETADNAKPAEGKLPVLNTGKTTGKEILQARVAQLLIDGFGMASVGAGTYYGDKANYFVAAYWQNSDYLKGHVAGSVNYISKSSLKSATTLKSLPADKKIAIYCYTGHTAAFATAFLKVMGYDVKSILYGGNGMAYDFMVTEKMSSWKSTDCMGYDVVK